MLLVVRRMLRLADRLLPQCGASGSEANLMTNGSSGGALGVRLPASRGSSDAGKQTGPPCAASAGPNQHGRTPK